MSEMRYSEAYEVIAARGRDGVVVHSGGEWNFYDALNEMRFDSTPELPPFDPMVVLEWEGDTAYITALDDHGYRSWEIERIVLEPEDER